MVKMTRTNLDNRPITMTTTKQTWEKVLAVYKGWEITQILDLDKGGKQRVEYAATLSLDGCLRGKIEIDYGGKDTAIATMALKQTIDIEKKAESFK